MGIDSGYGGRLRCWAALSLLMVAPTTYAQWGGALGVATEDVFRGLSQSDGRPSLQADAHYYGASGWLAGLSVATVRLGAEARNGVEFTPYLGYARPLTQDWSAKLALVRYAYVRKAPYGGYDYDELNGTLAWQDRLFVTATASPDTAIQSRYQLSAERPAYSYSLTLRQPLPLVPALSADAGIGYYDLRRQIGAGYVYWNAGLSYQWQSVQFDVAYIGTNSTAKSLFYEDIAENRWTASVLWRF